LKPENQETLENAVMALGAGTVEPCDVAIGAGDEAVGTGVDVDDDFSGVLHGNAPQGVLRNDNATGSERHVKVERRDMTKTAQPRTAVPHEAASPGQSSGW